jgi:hypothetical protein
VCGENCQKILDKMKRTFIFLLLLLLLAACSNGTPAPATPSAPPGATSTLAQPPTPTVVTVTPIPGRVLVVAPDPANPLASSVQARVAGLASDQKLVAESRAALQPSDLTPDVRVVVLLSAPDNLKDLLAAAPKTQFLLVGAGADPQPNLSVIRQDPDQVAFVAGYIATVISTDWRSAALLPDTPATLQQAFLNGGSYWCGRCAPIHGPIVIFPLVSALPKDSSLAAWQAALTKLKGNILETLYVDPSISSPDLLKVLGDQTMVLVGGQSPGSDALRQRWAATVSSDVLASLEALWPGLLAGTGGKSVTAAITLADINPSFLTPGKQLLVQQVIASLANGTLDALTPQ